MENKNLFKIKTKELIALCDIIDEYEILNKNIISFIQENSQIELGFELLKLFANKICNKKVKTFYSDNKKVIDTINTYYPVGNFINNHYIYPLNSQCLNFFYEYIKDNKDKIKNILELLEKIFKLGFDELEFNDNLEFFNEEHRINSYFYSNADITYLDNIEIIPTYRNDIIKYKSMNSNYKMILRLSTMKFSKYENKIIVNNLLFDSNILPNVISRETTFDKIIELKNSKNEEFNTLTTAIDLSVSINELNNEINKIDDILKLSNLNNENIKDKLINALSNIKENLKEIENINSEYDNYVCNSNKEITKEILENEKKLYLERKL